MAHWNLLPHLTGIRLDGPDALAFAHAQFTTAFTKETEPGWGLTAWCNPKGRVISALLARVINQTVELVAPSGLSAVLSKRLPMYSIGRKVEITTNLTVAGHLDCRSRPDCRIRLAEPRGMRLATSDTTLDEEFVIAWKALDVCAGIVWLSPTQSEQHIPQALGLGERAGLNFKKGCYPGQEIVARVHYLGRAKHMLKGFKINGVSDETLDEPIDEPIEELVDDAGAPIGPVVSIARKPEALIGLAVVGIDAAADQAVRFAGRSGRLCDPGDLC